MVKATGSLRRVSSSLCFQTAGIWEIKDAQRDGTAACHRGGGVYRQLPDADGKNCMR